MVNFRFQNQEDAGRGCVISSALMIVLKSALYYITYQVWQFDVHLKHGAQTDPPDVSSGGSGGHRGCGWGPVLLPPQVNCKTFLQLGMERLGFL